MPRSTRCSRLLSSPRSRGVSRLVIAPKSKSVFPNENSTRPIIHAPRGSDVELVILASRPVKQAMIEIMTGNIKKELPTQGTGDTFRSKWMLDGSGQFRVVFMTIDGEENADRDWHAIEAYADEAPSVVLTSPGKDVQLP